MELLGFDSDDMVDQSQKRCKWGVRGMLSTFSSRQFLMPTYLLLFNPLLLRER